ncbi:MAG: hypothetical protein ACRYGF_17405 [Janthinobacterium lividum]
MPTEFNERDHFLSQKPPSTGADEHGMSKPMPHPSAKFDAEHPGYEVTDVNAKGVVVFIGGLLAFLFVFFILCYAIGGAINGGLLKQDQEAAAHNPLSAASPQALQRRGASLANNPVQEQQVASEIAQSFPTPRVPTDDDNQETADMHAREDLLLEHYTAADPADGPAGTIHIPIERAMQLVVQRGLPKAAIQVTSVQTGLTGDRQYSATAPLTSGFARTAYELDQMESREQRLSAGESPIGAQSKPNPTVAHK